MSNIAHGRILFPTNPKYLHPFRQCAIKRDFAIGQKRSYERETMDSQTGERTWM
ncbi:hypothetical protein [Pseudoalteromonas rhizosphaerae]|uniref:hypothetical protein n=1 Tax=Pseudoalteromonas rhizosphaerae TaxID=2518973 RepID=UPI003703AD6B